MDGWQADVSSPHPRGQAGVRFEKTLALTGPGVIACRISTLTATLQSNLKLGQAERQPASGANDQLTHGCRFQAPRHRHRHELLMCRSQTVQRASERVNPPPPPPPPPSPSPPPPSASEATKKNARQLQVRISIPCCCMLVCEHGTVISGALGGRMEPLSRRRWLLLPTTASSIDDDERMGSE